MRARRSRVRARALFVRRGSVACLSRTRTVYGRSYYANAFPYGRAYTQMHFPYGVVPIRRVQILHARGGGAARGGARTVRSAAHTRAGAHALDLVRLFIILYNIQIRIQNMLVTQAKLCG